MLVFRIEKVNSLEHVMQATLHILQVITDKVSPVGDCLPKWGTNRIFSVLDIYQPRLPVVYGGWRGATVVDSRITQYVSCVCSSVVEWFAHYWGGAGSNPTNATVIFLFRTSTCKLNKSAKLICLKWTGLQWRHGCVDVS